MDINLKWLVLGELIIISIIFVGRYIFKKMEEKKVNNILEYIEKKSKNKEVDKKFKECIDIIKQNNKDTDTDKSKK